MTARKGSVEELRQEIADLRAQLAAVNRLGGAALDDLETRLAEAAPGGMPDLIVLRLALERVAKRTDPVYAAHIAVVFASGLGLVPGHDRKAWSKRTRDCARP